MLPNITKEEIHELGFIKTLKNAWIGWEDYILNEIQGEYGYYLRITLHIPKVALWDNQEMLTKILIHRYYNGEEPERLEEFLHDKESEQIYLGNIRSKEHLKQLLIDLFINKDGKES